MAYHVRRQMTIKGTTNVSPVAQGRTPRFRVLLTVFGANACCLGTPLSACRAALCSQHAS